MARVYGIDMGTSTLKIYQKARGIIYSERNAVAVFENKKVIAIGDEAWQMEGKTPPNIEVAYPVRSGVPADVRNMVTQLNMIFNKLSEIHGKMNGQEFMIAIPTNITEVEKRAYVELVEACDIKPGLIRVVDKPIADALGADVDIKEVTGTIIVDIGAETTELSVLSNGGIVTSRTLNYGGKRLDENIIAAVRKYYNFMVGAKTAEQIKIKLGSATHPEESEIKTLQVFGRKLVSGLPGSIPIDSEFVYLSIKDTLELIVDAIKAMLTHVPPEISADVMTYGIYLTGGMSSIKNFGRLVKNITGLPVHTAEKGSESVVLGLGKIMEEKELDIFAEKYSGLQIMD